MLKRSWTGGEERKTVGIVRETHQWLSLPLKDCIRCTSGSGEGGRKWIFALCIPIPPWKNRRSQTYPQPSNFLGDVRKALICMWVRTCSARWSVVSGWTWSKFSEQLRSRSAREIESNIATQFLFGTSRQCVWWIVGLWKKYRSRITKVSVSRSHPVCDCNWWGKKYHLFFVFVLIFPFLLIATQREGVSTEAKLVFECSIVAKRELVWRNWPGEWTSRQ